MLSILLAVPSCFWHGIIPTIFNEMYGTVEAYIVIVIIFVCESFYRDPVGLYPQIILRM